MSGFAKDPEFQIIWMPDREENEKDAVSRTERSEADVSMADTAASGPDDRGIDHDSSNAG